MESVASIKQKTQLGKRKKRDFWLATGYTVHRNISVYITFIFVNFLPKVTPNHISYLMITVGMVGIFFLAHTDPGLQILGVSLIYISFLLDKVDGEVARFTDTFSVTGMYLDEVYHAVIGTGVIAAVFFPIILSGEVVSVALAMLVVLLSLYRRYERKSYILISNKVRLRKALSPIDLTATNTTLLRITQWWPFKLTAIVERFDLLLLAILVLSTYSLYSSHSLLSAFFCGYSVLVVLYAVRRCIFTCAGGIKPELEQFLQSSK